MTIDEAIKHLEEETERIERNHPYIDASEYRQLAEWLRELKEYRKIRRILSQNRIATDKYGEVVLWDDIKRVFEEVKADDERRSNKRIISFVGRNEKSKRDWSFSI